MPVIPPRPLKAEAQTLYNLALVIRDAIRYAHVCSQNEQDDNLREDAIAWLARVKPLVQVLIEQNKHVARMRPKIEQIEEGEQ